MANPLYVSYSHSDASPARKGRLATLAGIAVILAACASPADIPPGTSLTDMEARYGAPTIDCPLPDGTRHVVWSGQPMGQFAWATTVTPDGRVGQIEQILTDRAFATVKVGEWNADRLLCMFGPPAEKSEVGLPSNLQHIWSYRYRQSGAWNSLMHFYIGPDGRITRMHPGPDPMFEPVEWDFR